CGIAKEIDVDDVVDVGVIGMTTVLDRADLGGCLDHTFGKEKAGRERTIVARRSHRDGERLSMQSNLERLFYREAVSCRAIGLWSFTWDTDDGEGPLRRCWGPSALPMTSRRPPATRPACTVARAGNSRSKNGRYASFIAAKLWRSVTYTRLSTTSAG